MNGIRKTSYPNPCDSCQKTGDCSGGYGCQAWRIRYRYRQKQINAYAKRKNEEYLGTRFVYQHPNDTLQFLKQWPCEHCEQKEDCDIPCTKYLNWYDCRIQIVKRRLGR